LVHGGRSRNNAALPVATSLAAAVFELSAIFRTSPRCPRPAGFARRGSTDLIVHLLTRVVTNLPWLLGVTVVGLLLSPTVSAAAGRTFYVAPWGRDDSSGLSPDSPWRTVGHVNLAALLPGDRVLFKGGQTFTDDSLMPGSDSLAAGTERRPIVFGSYGGGRAQLSDGIWFGANPYNPSGPTHVVFQNLILGPQEGLQGTGQYITLSHLWISRIYGHGGIGIQSEGSHWTITGNEVDHTADSGMLLGMNSDTALDPPGGSHYVIRNNVVDHTGLNGQLGHGAHAIYLKVADATVAHNRIIDFRDDGISARYHGARIIGNYIDGGGIGIAWFQYDRHSGTSEFIGNTIAQTSEAGIFVCGVADACLRPLENFVIRNNHLAPRRGRVMDLEPGRGRYRVVDNP
jgi:Right handed beta helix region